MYFDKFSEIGASHKTNEDYAVIGDEANPFVIVSDGCSGSKNTDIGSRILSLVTAKLIKEYPTTSAEFIGNFAIHQAWTIIKSLGLEASALDATLIIGIVRENEIDCCMWGDGTVFIKFKDNPISIGHVRYTPEMPYYLSYKVDPERNADYEAFVNAGKIEKRKVFINSTCNFSVDVLAPVTFSPRLQDLEYFMIASDGVESFVNDKNESCNQSEIYNQLTAFKSMKGVFVGRRMNRMKKLNRKEGITHYDDLTLAGISFLP